MDEFCDVEEARDLLMKEGSLLKKSEKHFSQENYSDCITLHKKLIKFDPNNPKYYLSLAMFYDLAGDYKNAIEYYCMVTKFDGFKMQGITRRANCFMEMGEMDKAMTDYSNVINGFDNEYTVMAYFNRGLIFQKKKLLLKSNSDFTSIIEGYATDDMYIDYLKKSYLNRGVNYYHLKEYEKAISDYTTLIDIDGNFKTSYFNRGLTYVKLKKCRKAANDFTSAIACDPNYSLFYYERASVNIHIFRYRRALIDLKRCMVLDAEKYGKQDNDEVENGYKDVIRKINFCKRKLRIRFCRLYTQISILIMGVGICLFILIKSWTSKGENRLFALLRKK